MSEQLTQQKRGPGRPRKPATRTYSVRCTEEGWGWLKEKTRHSGHESIGKYLDAKGENRGRFSHEVKGHWHLNRLPWERGHIGPGYSFALRGLRAKYGWSQANLAKVVGVSPRTVQGWEHGREPSYPTLTVLKRLEWEGGKATLALGKEGGAADEALRKIEEQAALDDAATLAMIAAKEGGAE